MSITRIKKYIYILLTGMVLLMPNIIEAQEQRFPRPEFESGYTQPNVVTPEPRSATLEYFDVIVLLVVLSLASYYVLKRRSRNGILFLSIFTLFYFGFYRNGCICSIGSIQNLSLSLSDPTYAISLTVLLFFILPLIFSLFFGRVFCAGACPLGAIQDLIIVKPIDLPVWLRKTLGIFPYIYLSLAVLYAVTGTDFIICRYDPFIGIFRMEGSFLMIVLGISFLLIGLFVARPYCRFLCPYGVLLSWMSRFSKWHLSITPSKCIKCKLCSTSCPFEAINFPTEKKDIKNPSGIKKFLIYAVLIPAWVFVAGFIGSKSDVFLSRAHPDVYLAELMIKNPDIINDLDNIDVQTFLASDKTMETLIEEANIIRDKFHTGGWFIGGFIGLVVGLTVLNQIVYRKREDYEPDKGDCVSCGRCMDYCPVEK